jgi:hypothetical protein
VISLHAICDICVERERDEDKRESEKGAVSVSRILVFEKCVDLSIHHLGRVKRETAGSDVVNCYSSWKC